MRNVVAFIFVACTAAACNPPAPAPQPAAPAQKTAADQYRAQINFDGGYAFVRRNQGNTDPVDDTLLVAALMEGHKEKDEPHRMRLEINRGDIKAGSDVGDWDQALQTWQLNDNDYDLKLTNFSGGVQVPASTAPGDCKNPVPGNMANNLALIPNISQIASDLGANTELSTDRADYGNRVAFDGGTVFLRSVASCFEYAAKGAPKHQQYFTNGQRSVQLEGMFDKQTPFKISVTKGGTTKYIEIAPDSRGVIELSFGRPLCLTCKPLGMNDELKHFQRFFNLFKKNPNNYKWPKPMKKAGLGLGFARAMTPGDECPPGWYEEPLLSRASAATTPGGK